MTNSVFVAVEIILLVVMIIVVNSRVSALANHVNMLQGDTELCVKVLTKMLSDLEDENGYFEQEDQGAEGSA